MRYILSYIMKSMVTRQTVVLPAPGACASLGRNGPYSISKSMQQYLQVGLQAGNGADRIALKGDPPRINSALK